ncbi:transmembrane protein 60, partial [Biomphalaria glabrata]
NMVMHYVKLYIQNVDRNEMTKTRKYVLIVCCLLKIIFQVLLCLRLENFPINLYLVLIPFWTLFIAGLIDNFRVLVLRHPYR